MPLTTYTAGEVLTAASLNNNLIFAAANGKVVQVVQGTTTTQVDTSLATYVDTGLTATITPTVNTSKVLVWVVHGVNFKSSGNIGNGTNMKLFRGATELLFNRGLGITNNAIDLFFSTGFLTLDSPATTSATTYKTQFANETAAASVSVQRISAPSKIILMEILA